VEADDRLSGESFESVARIREDGFAMTRRSLFLVLCCLLGGSSLFAARERLELRRVSLDLPGPPARVLPWDLNGDGRQDLVVVVAYTEIEEVGEDFIEDLVQISRVIPTLFDRREVRAYLAVDDGGYELAGAPLELPLRVLHMEVGAAGLGVIALTDDGIAQLRFDSDPAGEITMRLEPAIADPPLLARTRRFYADLELVHDLDGDGIEDVLLPGSEAPTVYLGNASGLSTTPTQRIRLPLIADREGERTHRSYPLPEVVEVNGDSLPDLVFAGLEYDRAPIDVYLGSGGGRFRPLRQKPLDCHDRQSDLRLGVDDPEAWPWPRGLTAFGDLNGDGRAEVVTSIEKPRGDSWRKEMKDAKKPIQTFGFHELGDDLTVDADPYFEMKVIGHSMEGSLGDDDDESGSPFEFEQFIDLDGDGREDLITVTLDFSIFQVVKIMATKKIGIGLNFHVYAQQADGSFREVPDLDLSEKLKFDLNDLKIGRFAQFAGDFDGDGRQDFVHLGRGKLITVHRGQPGCVYPKDPDLAIELEEEPARLDLVRIEDLDGDGRADIRITRPLPIGDPDVTAPVRLELYLSGGQP
jgi:hypothetical protein